jgi:branched-chain amino acid transport system ATP-binding protein
MSALAASQEARLYCRRVTVHFGGVAAVNDVDLDVPAGTIVGLVGPNGAGKSTLFGVLSGLVRPSHGRVVLEGEDVTNAWPQVRSALGLARTFQHPELFTDLTVREHLVLANRAKHARRRVWSDLFTMGCLRPATPRETEQVDELIDALGLDAVASRPALELPLGLARLVELGRALASTPTVVLLDEPSSGLDSSETEQFEATLRRISHQRGLSVLLVEHDVDLVMRLCSVINVLDFGVTIATGSPEEIRDDAEVRAAYLGQQLGGDDGAGDDPHIAGAELFERATMGSPDRAPDGQASSDQASNGRGSPLLVVEKLSVSYGEATALSGVSFELSAGTALAVLGTNGAGKSSLARAICGLVCPREGRIVFDDRQIAGWPAHRIRRAGLVYLPESRGVFASLTVADNIRMAAGAVEGRRLRRDAEERAFEIFPALADRRRQQASSLSGGEQQMLSMARALAVFPSLLIADEASLGLAPRLVELVFEGFERAKESGVTVIIIEQYVHRALDFADDCVVLQHGELAWSGPAAEAGSEVLGLYMGDSMTAAG